MGGRIGAVAFTATVALALLAAVPASAAKPPVPGPGPILTAGQLPHECTAADAGASGYSPMTGYYFSRSANAWVSAPSCYPRWGNLSATPPQIVAAGMPVTVTAIPDTNSSQFAPETKSIVWTFGGKRVAGCGTADLTCTVIPAPQATAEWQWVQFQVTMPRIFFVDSQGSLCAGQHLCAGNSTNAWSFVGVPPVNRLCVGTCKQLAVELPPEIGGGGSLGPVDLSCGTGASCDVKAQTTLDPKSLTIHQQIIDDSLKKQAERWQILKDTQTKIFDITKDVTTNKKNTAGSVKGQNLFNGYIYGSADSKDTVALQATDAELSPLFPGSGPSLNIAMFKRGASAAMPPADQVFRALIDPSPSRSELAALKQAIALANAPEYSTDRAVARITLTNGLVLGQRLLAAQGVPTSRGKSIVIGSASVAVPGGRSKQTTIHPTSLGERVLRLVDLARGGESVAGKVTIDLNRSGLRLQASRSIPLG